MLTQTTGMAVLVLTQTVVVGGKNVTLTGSTKLDLIADPIAWASVTIPGNVIVNSTLQGDVPA